MDDIADTARLTERHLKSLGYEVEPCRDGSLAIGEAREFHPEVALTDIDSRG